MAARDPRPNDDQRRDDEAPAGRLEEERVIPEMTHEDFKTLPLEDLAERVGLDLPDDMSSAEERAWREQAWQHHARDIANRDEWGTATQTTELPGGEDPNL